MPELKVSAMPYKDTLLQNWKGGNYGMLESSRASDYLNQILPEKSDKRRGTRRFLGKRTLRQRFPTDMDIMARSNGLPIQHL